MAARVEINNAVLKLSNEHAVFLDVLEKMDHLLLEPDPQRMFADLEKFQEDLQVSLANHFSFEESVLFPALLVGIPVEKTAAKTITLVKQHGVFLNHLKYWQNLSYLLDAGNPSHVRFVHMHLAQFIDLLKIHVKTEVEEIFPMIYQNPRCLTLIDTLAGKR